jgi:N-carbamoyl-L-amino-acid hydrolase
VAEIASYVRRLAHELGGSQVGTVGSIELRPGLVNVVASGAECTVDLRNTDAEMLAESERRLDEFLHELAAAEGVSVQTQPLARFEPVTFAPGVVELVERTAHELGHSVRRLPSGAGHDAQMMARVCPAGMVFVPSHRGISHNPAEHTDPVDIEAGANVLLHVLLALADADVLPVFHPSGVAA